MGGRIWMVAGLWVVLTAVMTAQRPEGIPGLEHLDSIPAASGYRSATRRTVYIDSAGVRSDGPVTERSEYDALGRIIGSSGYDGAGEELYRQTYQYDRSSGHVVRSLKNVTDDDEPSYDWHYSYDALGRIIRAEDSVSQVAVTYLYAAAGGSAPCIAISVTGRYRFSGIDSYCDSTGRVTRQIAYIGDSDTVVARVEYPSAGERRRLVFTDGNQRVRDWLYLSDSAGHVLTEEYRAGVPGRTETVYTIHNIYGNGLLQRRECHNYGSLDWIEYFEYRKEN